MKVGTIAVTSLLLFRSIRSEDEICIIGGGVSGIAAANVLQQLNYSVSIYEQGSSIGGVWSQTVAPSHQGGSIDTCIVDKEGIYPGVSLQNRGTQYHMNWHADMEIPKHYHEIGTSAKEIVQHIHETAEYANLTIHLNSKITSMTETPYGWTLQIQQQNEKKKEHVRDCDKVILATGQYLKKYNSKHAGQATFKGRVLTEREVENYEDFVGKRVAVVGFGKSALDMATNIATAQEKYSKVKESSQQQVYHVFRQPRWMLPEYIFGLHFVHLIFARHGTIFMPSWGHPPTFLAQALHHGRFGGDYIVDGFWRMIETVFRANVWQSSWGVSEVDKATRIRTILPKHDVRLDLRSAAPVAPEQYVPQVANGLIEPIQAELDGFDANGLMLLRRGEQANSVTSRNEPSVLDVDVVILSTGSPEATFEILPPKYRKILEHSKGGPQLYRHLIHPDIPNVGMAGMNHGFLHISHVEIGTCWLDAYWKGRFQDVPSRTEMLTTMARVQAWKQEHIRYEPGLHMAVNTRFHQYNDILLLEMGLTPYRKPNPIAEWFSYYRAADYAGIVSEYQANVSANQTTMRVLPVDM